jgi:hypothetical protein
MIAALGILRNLPWKWIGLALAIAGALWWAKRTWDGHAADAYKDGRSDLVAEQNAAEVGRLRKEIARREVAKAAFVQTGEKITHTIERITKENTVYASTPDGGSVGLPAERVRGILDTRAALFPSPSGRSAEPVPAGVTIHE